MRLSLDVAKRFLRLQDMFGFDKSPFFHNPALTYRSHSQISLSIANINPIAKLATSSVSTSGVLITLIPFCLQCPQSTLSNPTLKLDTISKAGNESINSRSAPTLAFPITARIEPEFCLKKSFSRGDSTNGRD
ncbi:unnamed protein product [Lactuca saligna]|uniref:TCP domain-containing protein n=1 Tax=Lactuca saligna TaxID=75948 RepID=A0AA36E340_LACSI|nr:unnamed protein product [Lactuca saligna]